MDPSEYLLKADVEYFWQFRPQKESKIGDQIPRKALISRQFEK
jgi:hypothetical protein